MQSLEKNNPNKSARAIVMFKTITAELHWSSPRSYALIAFFALFKTFLQLNSYSAFKKYYLTVCKHLVSICKKSSCEIFFRCIYQTVCQVSTELIELRSVFFYVWVFFDSLRAFTAFQVLQNSTFMRCFLYSAVCQLQIIWKYLRFVLAIF